MRSRFYLCVCVFVYPLSLLGNGSVNKPYSCQATARFGKTPPIIARQRLSRIVTVVVFNLARVVSRKVGD
jgi:hypothetical protein